MGRGGLLSEVFGAIFGVISQILRAGHLGAKRAGKSQHHRQRTAFSFKSDDFPRVLIVFDVSGIGLKGNFGSHLGLLRAILKV